MLRLPHGQQLAVTDRQITEAPVTDQFEFVAIQAPPVKAFSADAPQRSLGDNERSAPVRMHSAADIEVLRTDIILAIACPPARHRRPLLRVGAGLQPIHAIVTGT
ncbi:hypothetical protein FJK98_03325 [Micromonospora sp. HM134]|nr:hypothetical protein FJK98_03325 [Micromonospora sp. HM134]